MEQTPQKSTQPAQPVKHAQPVRPVAPPPYPYGYPPRPAQPNRRQIKKQQMPVKETKPKKKHYWWRYLLFSLLGFFVAIGTIVGGGYAVAARVPMKKYISLFGGDPNKIITETYQDDSLITIITKFVDGTISVSTLGGIASFTPLVDNLYNSINSSIQSNLGVGLNKEELYAQSFSNMGDYIFTYFKQNATLADFLKIQDPTSQSKVIQYLCYKKDAEGNLDYTAKRTLDEVMAGLSDNSLLNDAKLGELLDIKEDSKLYKFKDITLGEFTNDFDEKIKEMKISDLVDIDITDPNCNPFLKSLVVNEVKVGELSDYLNNRLRIADIIQDTDGSKIIQSLIDKNPLVGDIGKTVQAMTISEVIDIDESSAKILQSMKDWKISELASKFNSLKVSDIFTQEEIEYNKFLSSIPSDTLITDLGEAIENCKIVDIFENEIWGLEEHTTANIQDEWRYLLLHSLDDSSEAYRSYTVSDSMETMIDNMKYNIMNTSINRLLEDEMISVDDTIKTGLLTKKSMNENTNEEFLNPTGRLYGELTVSDFITRLSWFVDKASSIL